MAGIVEAPRSWNGWPRTRSQLHVLHAPHLPSQVAPPWLCHGNGRSYGDVCLNDGGALLLTRALDRYIAFDEQHGLLRCEAGATFDEILKLIVPRGWFLPVTPGTRFVTVGGAIANDVHGKNHHKAGSFGAYVTRLELLRSDGSRTECSPTQQAALFSATIGGLGLTGIIASAEFRLLRIAGPMMLDETFRYGGLAEFFALSDASAADWDYTVAWVDCLVGGDALGRGVFSRARHAAAEVLPSRAPRAHRVPFTPPLSLVNGLSLRAFNELYFRKAPAQPRPRHLHYEPFFYPLDALLDWNRIYGPRGFLQHQCVLPPASREAVSELFREIARVGTGSFLAVLKLFGDRPSPGMLSFPRPGVTLALDFPLHGAETLALLDRLDAIVASVGGAIYPAKDARMSAAMFRSGFPRWAEFREHIDPAFSSSFWRRVM